MKQAFTIISIMISFSFFAQKSINAFAGINYSYYSDGFAGQILAEESFGIHIGASYEVPLNNKISFRPAIAFDQVGDRTISKDPVSSEINNLDVRLSYINIPLDFKFWNRIYLFGGPQIGFLISKESDKGGDTLIQNNVDFGIRLGTGFTINKLFFEFSLYQGVTSLGNYRHYLTGSQKDIHNGYGNFTIGYRMKV